MAINLKSSVVENREQRLGTIIRWDGSAAQLAQDSSFTFGTGTDCGRRGKRLCEAETPFSQASMCAECITVVNATLVQGAVVIQHSPIGCASSQAFTCRNYRDLSVQRGWEVEDPHSLCSNLTEDDMVFGGIAKLEQTVRDAWNRYHPKVVFIATSCATGIIGDDVDGLATQLSQELGTQVITLPCEGFRAKHWSTGWDIIEHGILRNLVDRAPSRKQEDLINVIHLGGPDVFTPLLGQLGLRVNLVMGGSTLETFARLTQAAATVTMCSVLSYLAAGLEREYGVPEVRATLPYGLQATDDWLREIARITHREDRVEDVIRKEHDRLAPELERLRRQLAGKRGFVAAGASFAHGLIADLRELGVLVEGAYSYHHDPSYDSNDPRQDLLAHVVNTYGDVPKYTVSADQQFQAYVALCRARPDFALSRHGGNMALLTTRLGIPTFPIFYSNDGLGYQGLLNIGRGVLRVLARRPFLDDIAAHSRFPYQSWWLRQNDPFAFPNSSAAPQGVHEVPVVRQ